nr:hypothetical protein [uncultured Methanoregula sp.]
MRERAVRGYDDLALSEVIGFILIIALIVVIASLYLTYGVPAQGRETEILHMNDIKDEFVSYKLSLDALFTNDKVGSTVSNSFSPGTEGGYTQGMLSFIPLMSPVPSSGILALNDPIRDEVLTIESQSLVLDPTVRDSTDLPSGTSKLIQNTPQDIYVNLSLPAGSVTSSTYYGTDVSGTGWKAIVNLTPRISYLPSISGPVGSCPAGTSITGMSGLNYYCMNPSGTTVYNGTDIRITAIKGGSTTIQDLPVFTNITANNKYTVDLMDPAYGLASAMTFPDTLTLNNNYAKNAGAITGSGNATFGYRETTYKMPPLRLGSIEYRTQNNYWIPQTYYYQMGGVFLAQNDGNITWKQPPEITATNDTVNANIAIVNINALTLNNRSQAMIGGNSPIQIRTTLDRMTQLPIAPVNPGTGNTKWIRIAINTTDNQSRTLWQNYFNYMVRANGIPNTVSGYKGNESYLFINGSDSTLASYDLNVIAWNATYTPSVQGVGGIVQ